MDTETKGLGLWMAVIFLAGQMAGVGVLALPSAMVGTGQFRRVKHITIDKFIILRSSRILSPDLFHLQCNFCWTKIGTLLDDAGREVS